MPARKKPKPVEIWNIICDGLRIDTAPTKAAANSKKVEWEKAYPPNMNFTVEPAGQNSTHVTTA